MWHYHIEIWHIHATHATHTGHSTHSNWRAHHHTSSNRRSKACHPTEIGHASREPNLRLISHGSVLVWSGLVPWPVLLLLTAWRGCLGWIVICERGLSLIYRLSVMTLFRRHICYLLKYY